MSQIKNKLIDQMNQESAPFIPALSVRPPFTQLIASGIKRLEIRTWETDYRGPLLICASKQSHDLFCSYDFRTNILILDNKSAKQYFRIAKEIYVRDRGAVCLVDLVGVRPFMKGQMQENDACIDWIPNAYAWELENPRIVEYFPIKGQLRLFNVDASLINIIHQ